MDDALIMRGFERLGDLPGDRKRLVERNGPLGDAVCQGRSLDQLKDQSCNATGLLEAVNHRNVRMIQRRENLRRVENVEYVLVRKQRDPARP